MELLWTAMLVLGICRLSVSQVNTKGAIPEYLIDCYRQDLYHRRDHRLPMSLPTLIALVRKMELEAGANMDIRTVAVTLLHRLRMDGIERNPGVVMSEGVTPYRPSGRQFNKHRVLLKQLIPDTSNNYPNTSFSLAEKCTLHFMLSSAADPWERGDETETCPTGSISGTSKTGTSKTGTKQPRKDKFGRTLDSPAFYMGDTLVSRCPVEEGVIHSKWGTINPGALIAGVAAGLQRQQVKITQLVTPPSADQRRADSGLARRHHRYQMLADTDEGLIDNLWAATLAGDLAEVAVWQGPRLPQPMLMGPSGEWNDTYVPRAYYMEETHGGYWEMTDAETRGGADGLILGSNVKAWNDVLNRLRLSQLLEMYYSDRGVCFEPSIRACRRRERLREILTPTKLLIQASNFARILSYEIGNVQMEDDKLKYFCEQAVITAKNYESSLENNSGQAACQLVFQKHPRVNLIVIIDGTWLPDVGLGVLASLADGGDVSYYGSNMTVINGKTGDTMVQETKNAYEIIEKLASDNTTWPIGLNLFDSLAKAYDLIAYETMDERELNKIGGTTYVVLVLAYSASLSDTDQQRSKEKINDFKENIPDARLMYLTSELNKARFETLLTTYPYDKDEVLPSPNECTETVVPLIINRLLQVPGRLMGSACDVSSTKAQHEDYVLPSETKQYRVHPQYLGSRSFKIVIRGSGYGVLDVCVKRENDEPDSTNCRQKVEAHEEVELQVSQPCGETGSDCKPIFISVTGITSLTKCTEDDCRFPNQIRFTMEHEGLNCVQDVGTGQLSTASHIDCVSIFCLLQILPVLFSPILFKLN